MTEQHPITPPQELVQLWLAEFYGPESMPGMAPGEMVLHVAAVAARWGADQELEACCEHLKRSMSPRATVDYLRAARRPKPSSLKKQALKALKDAPGPDYPRVMMLDADQHALIRCALEALPDD